MKHRPFQTLPKISERSYWIPQQEVTKALQIISMHFPASFLTYQKSQNFCGPKKKKKKKSHIYPQRSSCLNCTLKILIPKSLEWHQNKMYEISIKALSSLVVDSLPGVWVQILCRIKD